MQRVRQLTISLRASTPRQRACSTDAALRRRRCAAGAMPSSDSGSSDGNACMRGLMPLGDSDDELPEALGGAKRACALRRGCGH